MSLVQAWSSAQAVPGPLRGLQMPDAVSQKSLSCVMHAWLTWVDVAGPDEPEASQVRPAASSVHVLSHDSPFRLRSASTLAKASPQPPLDVQLCAPAARALRH